MDRFTAGPLQYTTPMSDTRYTPDELLLFRGYLEWRRIYASMPQASSLQRVKWSPEMENTLSKLREDTAGLSDWDRPLEL